MTDTAVARAADGNGHQQATCTTVSWCWTFCSQCNALKTREQMRADRRFKTGRRPTCEECDPVDNRERKRAQQWLSDYRFRSLMYGIWPVWELVTPGDLIARYGDRCVDCSGGKFEVPDHRVPVAAGGHHVIDNLAPCCVPCNRRKTRADWVAIRRFREDRWSQVVEVRRP